MAATTQSVTSVVVGLEAAGQRLDWVLSLQAGITSRAMAKRLIDEGRVQVNGAPAEADHKMREGDSLRYEIPQAEPSHTLPQAGPLEILYEDAALIVINTSSGPERRNSRNRSTASGSANCSPDIPDTNRPPRISPRASSVRYTRARSRHGTPVVSRASTRRITTP